MHRLLLSLAVLSLATLACGSPVTPPPPDPADAGGGETPADLAAPANFRTTDVSASGISLAWDAVVGAQGYELFAGEGANPQTLADSPSGTSSRYTSVEAGKAYAFRVHAVDGERKGADAQLEVTVPPSAPENVTLTAVNDTSILVAWSASVGATNYRVENCTAFNPDVCTVLAETAETSATLSDLSRGTLLAIRVKAMNAGGESKPSAAINFYTAPVGPAITGFTPSAVNSVKVTYGEAIGAQSFLLQIGASATGPFFTINETPSLNGYSTGVRFGETYFYRVVAVNDSGRGVGAVSSFTVPDGQFGVGGAPPTPGNVAVTATSSSEVEVGFSGTYQVGDLVTVLVASDSIATQVPLSAGDATNKVRTVKWLEPATQYCFTLEAMRPAGGGPIFSTRTTPVCVTTPQ